MEGREVLLFIVTNIDLIIIYYCCYADCRALKPSHPISSGSSDTPLTTTQKGMFPGSTASG